MRQGDSKERVEKDAKSLLRGGGEKLALSQHHGRGGGTSYPNTASDEVMTDIISSFPDADG